MVRIVDVAPAAASQRGLTGIVAARVQSDLGFRVGGKITERLVDVGQTVKAGQPIMRLDRSDFEHAITAQVGNVAAARARLIQAAADEARYRGLVSSGAVSKSAYDQAKAAADSAKALLDAAQAQLKIAQDDASYATLLADADGVVVETLVEPGQVVAAGQVVARLAHAGPREASISLPETVRPAIGSVAQAGLYGNDTKFHAKLRQLSGAADPLTRTYEARYVLDGAGANAPLGATVTVYLPIDGLAPAASVPLSALDDEGKGPGVWKLDAKASQVSFQPVQVLSLGQETAILSAGVMAGEQIVALGGHLLHQGQHVRVVQDVALAR
ncbi:MAG TPA: efflux RND transporter periplasmic adaptor subunit [Rhodopila sp.]|nr:efflux RND transporter periplasmic adaptor subunit [Rhodopila sp.]